MASYIIQFNNQSYCPRTIVADTLFVTNHAVVFLNKSDQMDEIVAIVPLSSFVKLEKVLE